MNKKTIAILLLSCVVTIVIILFGKVYSTNKQKEVFQQGKEQQSALDAERQKKTDAEKTELDNKIAGFKANRANLSLLNYMELALHNNGKLKIAFYGDESEAEKWTTQVETSINEELATKAEITRAYFPGYDSTQLINETTEKDIVAQKPAIVFFFLPVVSNQKLDSSLEDSNANILSNYQNLKAQLPESLIVAVTPTPKSALTEVFNSRMLDYTAYLSDASETLTQNAIPLVNLYDLYTAKLQKDGVTLESSLDETGNELNEDGVKITMEIFMNQLKTPFDTTSGMP